MKIQDYNVQATDNTDALINRLLNIPQTFTEYHIETVSSYQDQLKEKMISCYYGAQSLMAQDQFADAVQYIQRTQSTIDYTQSFLYPYTIYFDLLLTDCYVKEKKIDKAIDLLYRKGIEYVAAGQYWYAEQYSDALALLYYQQPTTFEIDAHIVQILIDLAHDAPSLVALETIFAGLFLGTTYRIHDQIFKATEYHRETNLLIQGPLDYDAYNIEQRGYAFSDQDKIGTDNLQQCIAVIIYDINTKKTALIHFDKFTNPDSLQDVCSLFMHWCNSKYDYQVSLVGGRDLSDTGSQISKNNLEKVLNVLKQYNNIQIVRADIINKKVPSTIVVDPATGIVEHKFPAKRDAYFYMRHAKFYTRLCTEYVNLDRAFYSEQGKIISYTLDYVNDLYSQVLDAWYQQYPRHPHDHNHQFFHYYALCKIKDTIEREEPNFVYDTLKQYYSRPDTKKNNMQVALGNEIIRCAVAHGINDPTISSLSLRTDTTVNINLGLSMSSINPQMISRMTTANLINRQQSLSDLFLKYVISGHTDVVQALINLHNSNIIKLTSVLEHALREAAKYGRGEIVQLFINGQQSNPVFFSYAWDPVLEIAIQYNQISVIKVLIAAKTLGTINLSLTLDEMLYSAAYHGDIELTTLLTQGDIISHIERGTLAQALITASKFGYLQIVKQLVDNKEFALIALYTALRCKKQAIVEYVFTIAPLFNIEYDNYNIIAAQAHTYLLMQGKKVLNLDTVQDDSLQYHLDLMLLVDPDNIIMPQVLLTQYNAKIWGKCLVNAVKKNEIILVRAIISCQTTLNIAQNYWNVALAVSSGEGYLQIVQLLIQDTGRYQQTILEESLHEALLYDQMQVVNELIPKIAVIQLSAEDIITAYKGGAVNMVMHLLETKKVQFDDEALPRLFGTIVDTAQNINEVLPYVVFFNQRDTQILGNTLLVASKYGEQKTVQSLLAIEMAEYKDQIVQMSVRALNIAVEYKQILVVKEFLDAKSRAQIHFDARDLEWIYTDALFNDDKVIVNLLQGYGTFNTYYNNLQDYMKNYYLSPSSGQQIESANIPRARFDHPVQTGESFNNPRTDTVVDKSLGVSVFIGIDEDLSEVINPAHIPHPLSTQQFLGNNNGGDYIRTLESATNLGNYDYWLQPHDIPDIARVYYRYNINEIEVIGSIDQLSRILNYYTSNNNNISQLTIIYNKDGNHWVSLVLNRQDNKYYGYYIDSLGIDIPNNIANVLSQYNVIIVSLNIIQQKDGYNDGFWALDNARRISLVLQENNPARLQDANFLKNLLHGSRTESEWRTIRDEVCTLLIRDNIRHMKISGLHPVDSESPNSIISLCLPSTHRSKRSIDKCKIGWGDIDAISVSKTRNIDKIVLDAGKILIHSKTIHDQNKLIQLFTFSKVILTMNNHNIVNIEQYLSEDFIENRNYKDWTMIETTGFDELQSILELINARDKVEQITQQGMVDNDYNTLSEKLKHHASQLGVDENHFAWLENHLEIVNKEAYDRYIDDIITKLQENKIHFDHEKFNIAKIQGAKTSKFLSIIAIYDLFDTIIDNETFGRHNNNLLKQVFGVNSILDTINDLRISLDISNQNQLIGGAINKVPTIIRKILVHAINNPIVGGITFIGNAWQFGYSINEIMQGNHNALNYYWTGSSGVKLASSITSISRVYQLLGIASKIIGKISLMTTVADIALVTGMKIHERLKVIEYISSRLPLSAVEKRELFFADLIKFFQDKDIEKEYIQNDRIRMYLDIIKINAHLLLEKDNSIAAIVQYVPGIKEKYYEVITDTKLNGYLFPVGGGCYNTKCKYKEEVYHYSYIPPNNQNIQSNLASLNISKTLPLKQHTLDVQKTTKGLKCGITPKSFGCKVIVEHGEINDRKVFIIDFARKYIPYLTQSEYEDSGLKVVSVPSSTLQYNTSCNIMNNTQYNSSISVPFATFPLVQTNCIICNIGIKFRDCHRSAIFSGEIQPFIFTQIRKPDPYHRKIKYYSDNSILYLNGPATLVAAENYPAVMYITENTKSYYGSKLHETIAIINNIPRFGFLEGGKVEKNMVVISNDVNNVTLHIYLCEYLSSVNKNSHSNGYLTLKHMCNYLSYSNVQQIIATQCKTKYINAAESDMGNKIYQLKFVSTEHDITYHNTHCTNEDYEIRVLHNKDTHYTGPKKIIFLMNKYAIHAEIIYNKYYINNKNNIDVINLQESGDITKQCMVRYDKVAKKFSLLINNAPNVISYIKVNSFNKLVIQALETGYEQLITINYKLLLHIVEDMKYQIFHKKLGTGIIGDTSIVTAAISVSKTINAVSETYDSYNYAKDIMNDNSLSIPIQVVLLVQHYISVPMSKTLIGGIYSDSIAIDFNDDKSNIQSQYNTFKMHHYYHNINNICDYIHKCSYYQMVTVEGREGQDKYIFMLPIYDNIPECISKIGVINLYLEIRNEDKGYHNNISNDIIDLSILNITNVNTLKVSKHYEHNVDDHCFTDFIIPNVGGNNSYISNITFDSQVLQWSLVINLVDYWSSPTYQHIIFKFNDNNNYKIDDTGSKLIEVNPIVHNHHRHHHGDDAVHHRGRRDIDNAWYVTTKDSNNDNNDPLDVRNDILLVSSAGSISKPWGYNIVNGIRNLWTSTLTQVKYLFNTYNDKTQTIKYDLDVLGHLSDRDCTQQDVDYGLAYQPPCCIGINHYINTVSISNDFIDDTDKNHILDYNSVDFSGTLSLLNLLVRKKSGVHYNNQHDIINSAEVNTAEDVHMLVYSAYAPTDHYSTGQVALLS